MTKIRWDDPIEPCFEQLGLVSFYHFTPRPWQSLSICNSLQYFQWNDLTSIAATGSIIGRKQLGGRNTKSSRMRQSNLQSPSRWLQHGIVKAWTQGSRARLGRSRHWNTIPTFTVSGDNGLVAQGGASSRPDLHQTLCLTPQWYNRCFVSLSNQIRFEQYDLLRTGDGRIETKQGDWYSGVLATRCSDFAINCDECHVCTDNQCKPVYVPGAIVASALVVVLFAGISKRLECI